MSEDATPDRLESRGLKIIHAMDASRLVSGLFPQGMRKNYAAV
jgi:hypothetical protein